ncbi:hypothetical protein QBC37DRAFT_414461 [Rhypophila decipiens]|uniref:Uncharacterized protein n=1 Tax=Rhypophila decipiens TaxID=261697 RepID=A0AAN7BBD7_9PEZI|nr:hypothetical protein QBC37DRAFT_414461 [Rhypophila decipiens]
MPLQVALFITPFLFFKAAEILWGLEPQFTKRDLFSDKRNLKAPDGIKCHLSDLCKVASGRATVTLSCQLQETKPGSY